MLKKFIVALALISALHAQTNSSRNQNSSSRKTTSKPKSCGPCPAGPTGPQGPAGSVGPAGPAGVAGITINGAGNTTWNLNGTTPAADSGFTAATFKTDGGTNVIAEVPTVTSISPTAVGGYFGDWENTALTWAATALGNFNQGTSNLVFFWMFRLPYSFTFNTLTIKSSNIGTATTLGIGIYSGTGTRLVHWDNITANSGLTYYIGTPSGGAVTLGPGFYYWAASQVSIQDTETASGLVFGPGTTEATRPWNTHGTVRNGTASNPMSGGVVPATLGTLTAGYPLTSNALPVWIVEPN